MDVIYRVTIYANREGEEPTINLQRNYNSLSSARGVVTRYRNNYERWKEWSNYSRNHDQKFHLATIETFIPNGEVETIWT